jgi:hypothetical protein
MLSNNNDDDDNNNNNNNKIKYIIIYKWLYKKLDHFKS